METLAIAFPFDLFGSAGTAAGAELLSDALREMLDDARREGASARSHAYCDSVRIEEFTFDTFDALKTWRQQARETVRQALKSNRFLLWLGGNHLSALPIYEEMSAAKSSLIIQFDAHLDIYNLSDSTPELSHGNFLLHAKRALPMLAQVGSRDLFLPAKHVREHFGLVFDATEVAASENLVVEKLAKLARSADQFWIDIDCDVFDPSFFPAVNGPLPFGISPKFLLRVLDAVWSPALRGVSISEFDPSRDERDQSLGTLIWLLEWMLLRRHEKR